MYCFALKIKKPPKFPNKVGIKSRFSCSLFFLLTTRSWKLDLKSQRFFPPQSTILGGLGSEIDTFTFILTSRSSLPQQCHESDKSTQNIAQLRSALSSFVIVLLITGYLSPFPAIPKRARCAQPPKKRDRKRAESPDLSRDSDNSSPFRPRRLQERLRKRIRHIYSPQLQDARLMDAEARLLNPAKGEDIQNFVVAIMKDDIYKTFYNAHGTGMDLPSHECEVSDG